MTNEDQKEQNPRRFQGPGGTPGGTELFFGGLALAIIGGYLIMDRVKVTGGSGYWGWWGDNTFGLTLIPLIIGIVLLFFNSKSMAGWILAGGGLLIIFAGIIASLRIYFERTSLFNTILMFTLFAAGLGLMARSLKSKA